MPCIDMSVGGQILEVVVLRLIMRLLMSLCPLQVLYWCPRQRGRDYDSTKSRAHAPQTIHTWYTLNLHCTCMYPFGVYIHVHVHSS